MTDGQNEKVQFQWVWEFIAKLKIKTRQNGKSRRNLDGMQFREKKIENFAGFS